jgi:aspartokinase-like uncharacterized kinase
MTATVVIKVGGSLLAWPGLPQALKRLLEAERDGRPVLVAGGGAMADVLRTLDSVHGIGENQAHALALRVLDVTAHVVAGLVPGLRLVLWPDDLRDVWQAGAVPVLAPRAFMETVDRREEGALPETWSTTSDSIAARIACLLGASRLMLLKSTAPAGPIGREEASRQGLVDPVFPRAARGLRSVVCVNLRALPPDTVELI